MIPEPEPPTSAEVLFSAEAPFCVPVCHEDVCLTCSDTAVAVRILNVRPGGLAVVETEAGPEEVSVALVAASPGDVVLVHAKEAIAVVARAGGSP